MRKFFSIKGKQVTVAITIVVLAFFAAWYYLIYIPDNEKALYERHFRWLQRTDKNIRAKFDAYDSLLSNLFQAFNDTSLSDYKKKLANIRQNLPGDAVLFPPEDLANKKDKSGKNEVDSSKFKGDLPGIQYSLRADPVTNKLIISAARTENADSVVISISKNFEEFLKPLLEPGTFDHYVVFFQGRYIYEDFHSGLGYKDSTEDSLLLTGKWVTGATVIDQRVGGVEYKMFLQPINFPGNSRLIVAGLHSLDRFNAERKQLPPNAVLLAIIVALGVLLLFPWIRLYFLGKFDRLTLGDAAESLLVAKLLMSLLVLFLFKYNFFSLPKDHLSSKILADKIGNAFRDEIDSAYNYLSRYDSLMNSDDSCSHIVNLGNDSIRFNSTVNPKGNVEKRKTILKDLYKQFPLTEVNWMDEHGTIIYNWTTASHNSKYGNYEDRGYFRDIQRRNTIQPRPGTPVAFTLEQIISRTNGIFETVICKNSVLSHCGPKSKKAVVVMDWTMKSLDSIIMPAGYSAAIIDNTGEVRYHSKKHKNLNENLLEEFSNKKELQEALNGSFMKEFETDYYETPYSVRVAPLNGYPYFIVIMNDRGFNDSVNIETFAFSWGMILVFLIIVLIDLAILILTSSRRSLFKRQSLVTSWLWPRKSSAYEYLIAGVGNVIMIFLLGISMHSLTYLSRSFMLLLSVPLLTMFLNTIFLYKYRREEKQNYRRYKVVSAWCTGVFVVLLNIIAGFSIGRTSFHLYKHELILIASGLLLLLIYNRPGPHWKEKLLKSKSAYLYSFTFMAFTKLIVTSGIPVYFFYTASYNFEQNMLARNRQYDFVKQLQSKYPDPLELKAAVSDSMHTGTNYRNAVYTDETWIKPIEFIDTTVDSLKRNAISCQQENTAGLFNSFGSLFEDISGNNNDNFYKSSPDDSSYWFNNIFDSVLCGNKGNKLFLPLHVQANTSKGNSSLQKFLLVSTENLNYSVPGLNEFGFWVILFIVVGILYLILTDIVKKVCSLDTREISTWQGVTSFRDELLASGSSLWITGVEPYAISDSLFNILRSKRKDMPVLKDQCVLDFDYAETKSEANRPETEVYNLIGAHSSLVKPTKEVQSEWDTMKSKILTSESPYIFLMNIGSRPRNEKITQEKLSCIQSLMQKEKHLIFISPVHPLDLQEMMMPEMTGEKTTLNAKELTVFNYIFSGIPVTIQPLTDSGPYTDSWEMTGINDEKTKRFLHAEYRYTVFLDKLHKNFPLPDTSDKYPKGELSHDLFVLQVQALSHNFYTGVWQSLSPDEKFVLYDLAEDGLVNIKNRFAVNLLINKGLIMADEGHLHIFNRSFRHFIVSGIGSADTTDIDQVRKTGSNWNRLKMPLLIMVAGIFIFLGLSQQGMYTKLIAVFSSITAGIPVVLKILSMLGVQNERQSKTVPEKDGDG